MLISSTWCQSTKIWTQSTTKYTYHILILYIYFIYKHNNVSCKIPPCFVLCIFNSSETNRSAPYTAVWYNRWSSEDPWISTLDNSVSSDKMVYESDGGNFDGPGNHNGNNVWIRYKEDGVLKL